MESETDRTTSMYEAQLDRAYNFLKETTGFEPEAVLVLGSGLGGYADKVDAAYRVPYADVPGWPLSTAPGHEGNLIFGTRNGTRVAVFAGRLHAYEGYTASEVVLPLRSVLRMGARQVLLTNAAGAIKTTFRPGSIMIITDHINLTGYNPLTGPNIPELGVRFPDMSEVYSPRLCGVLEKAAENSGFYVEHGVYAYMHGPSYETPAEIRALRVLGADAVGMSTVPEAIASVHAGVEVAAMSVLSNLAAGVGADKLTEQEVLAAGEKAEDKMTVLTDAFLQAAHADTSTASSTHPPEAEVF